MITTALAAGRGLVRHVPITKNHNLVGQEDMPRLHGLAGEAIEQAARAGASDLVRGLDRGDHRRRIRAEGRAIVKRRDRDRHGSSGVDLPQGMERARRQPIVADEHGIG